MPAPTLLGTGALPVMTSLIHCQEVGNETRQPPEVLPGAASSNGLGCFLLVQVMVWIHGGGLVVGGASTYDGLALSAHENVVVVTIQYRLGIWGFFR